MWLLHDYCGWNSINIPKNHNIWMNLSTFGWMHTNLHSYKCKRNTLMKNGLWILVLVWYIGECMLSIINIDNDINELTYGHQNCHTIHIVITTMHVGYAKVGESLYPWVVIWVNTILNHVHTRVIPWHCYPCMKVFAWYIDMNGIQKTKIHQIPIPSWWQQIWMSCYRHPCGI